MTLLLALVLAANVDLTSLQAAAEKGTPHAKFEYAHALYEANQRVEAGVWMQKAAESGDAEAEFWLGYAGLGPGPDLVHYEKAAEMGYAKAFDYVFERTLFRAGADADVATAKKFADLAREKKIDLGRGAESTLSVIDRCAAAGKPVVPPADVPSPEERKTLEDADCDSFEGDRVKYRKCLLASEPAENVLLAEVYANGWGVPKNRALALALVCHGASVPAELTAMVSTLSGPEKGEFLFCDHITSGMNGGWCSARKQARAERKRDERLLTLTAKWTAPQKVAFDALRTSADTYFSLHATEEQDMSGTARASIAIAEEERLRERFYADLGRFEAGSFPTSSDYTKADQALNAAYSRLQKAGSPIGTVTREGIQKTERAWIKYRDAWVRFAAARYPSVPADAWKAWLTALRTDELGEIAAE